MGLNDGRGHVAEDGKQLSSGSLLSSEERARPELEQGGRDLRGKRSSPSRGSVLCDVMKLSEGRHLSSTSWWHRIY